jgi:hypothetical protein
VVVVNGAQRYARTPAQRMHNGSRLMNGRLSTKLTNGVSAKLLVILLEVTSNILTMVETEGGGVGFYDG